MEKLYSVVKKKPYKVISKCKYLTPSIKRLWKKDGINYDKVTYYPRKPDHQDPPIQPSKLFLIEKVKPYKGQPYWDKRILDSLHFNEFYNEKVAIVKNTPQVCDQLMKIKHLIKITPIELPDKLPDDLLTNKDTCLHPNGKLMIFPRVDQKRLDAFDKFHNNAKKMNGETIRKYLRLKWLNPIESNGSVFNNVNNNN